MPKYAGKSPKWLAAWSRAVGVFGVVLMLLFEFLRNKLPSSPYLEAPIPGVVVMLATVMMLCGLFGLAHVFSRRRSKEPSE